MNARREHQDWAFTLAVTLIGLVPRLFVAIAWSREPVWDGHYYHFGATRIAEGHGYSEDVIINGEAVWKAWCHYPVGYSGMLGGIYKVFGSDILVAPVVNAIIGGLIVLVSHRLARYYLGENRARVAAGLVALHPGLIAYSAVVMTELLGALLITAAGWFTLRFRGRHPSFWLSGLVLGLGTLVRPSSLLAAPLIALTQPKPRWRALLWGGVASIIAVATVLPWTYRNCQVMDECTFVSSNGGWNLAIGAMTETGRFRGLKPQDGCREVTGQVQQDRCWGEVGRKIIAENPGRWLKLIPKKLGHTYDHESFAIAYLHEADPQTWPESRKHAGQVLISNFHRGLLAFSALAVVGLLGFRTSSRLQWGVQTAVLAALLALVGYGIFDDHHPFFWLAVVPPLVALIPLPGAATQGPAGRYLLGLVVITTLTHAVFFGDDRYHLVVSPALCLLAAAALRSPKERPANAGPRP